MEFIPFMDRAGCLLAPSADSVRISQDLLQSPVSVTPPWSFPNEGLLLAASASFFFFCHPACGILVPQPEIEPVTPAVEAWSLNHWATREVPASAS